MAKVDFRKLINQVKEKYKKAESFLRSLDWEKILSAFAYFPFIGWFFPLYFKEVSADCQKNAKEGFYLSANAAWIFLALYFLKIFTAGNIKIIAFLVAIIHLIGVVAYLAASVYLIYRTYRFGSFRIPHLSVKAEKLNI